MRADDPRELRDARNAAHLKFAAVVCEDRVVGDARVESAPYRCVAFRRGKNRRAERNRGVVVFAAPT